MTSERRRAEWDQVGGRRPAASGFTLIEMMVVVAILGIVAALSYTSYARARPRARLSATASEVQTAIMAARQRALATGRDVIVIFYPAQGTSVGVGRVVVFYDGDGGFMDGTQPAGDPSFATLDPAAPAAGLATGHNDILDVINIPEPVQIATPASLVTLTFPYNNVTPVPDTACSFCDAGMTVGAIRFDSKGRPSFHGGAGPFQNGGYVSLVSAELPGTYVLVVTNVGIVRSFNAG